ncbi:hypothetical protein Pla123a_23830 [Posidoniimonas polymericola]|uniref:rhamnogalacturonan endolyase n=1 Tax=Posidoniimonas polymericola TaxID=2528002 RepID=A0A5C5YQ89_9BACT|nr:rhamnogalacturonan lyase B N-terminal domain-containing protein [Posidoniimonas polymericola]TWT76958.1 hypothetical protein Pla123a_23830 [Posidoniimonas polymericola]
MSQAPTLRGKRLRFEPLEARELLAFGVTAGATPTGQSTLVIDNGDDLTFAVINGGGLSSTIHLGDLSSITYQGQELLAPYSATSRYSHYEQGLGSGTSISYSIGGRGTWIVVTCDDTANGVIQYYAVRKDDNNLYMASHVTAGGEGRFIAYLSRGVFTDIEEPSDISTNVGVVEGSDVFFLADGTTRSKFYNTRRMIENQVHGVTGAAGSIDVGVWMDMGNRENSSGGPFFKDIDFQTTGGATEIYNVLFSGHTQTEPYRYGMQGPYAMQVTDGSDPVEVDYSWMEFLGLEGWVPESNRGSVSGVADIADPAHETVVGLSNADAQYWAIADPVTGAYSIDGIEAGEYTMTLYDQELEVGVRTVAIAAQSELLVDIANTYYLPAATWRIGEWDGTPAGFMNADLIATMHPSDVRMAPWVSGAYVVGTDATSEWPMAQFMDVNNAQQIQFTLTAAEAAASQTLRIGITLGFAGGRNRITVNPGQAYSWTSGIPAASINLQSRGITRGTYRGPNQVYTYDIPAGALRAGVNTIDLPVVSGSSGSGFLSPNVVYDAIDLVPTASLTNAPRLESLTLSPSSVAIAAGESIDFTALGFDQFGAPIAANVDFAATGGAIDQTGRFTAPAAPGAFTITATSGGATAEATVLVLGEAPVVVSPAAASPSPAPDGIVSLSVLGDDDGGEANLTYTWSVVGSPPGAFGFTVNGTNAAKNTTAMLSQSGDYDLLVTITDADGNSATSHLTVSRRAFVAQYQADETGGATLADSSGAGADASLTGAYSFSEGRIDNALDLSGGYATLPAGIVSGLDDFTISTWVKLDSLDNWERVFDFGDDTSNYMFLTPQASTGRPRFAIRTPSIGEQVVDSSVAMPIGRWTHVAVTQSGGVARLYINGVMRGTNASMTLTPADLGETSANYLGKSQWPDPALDGAIDEFRIYGHALSGSEVSALASPPVLPGDYNGDSLVDAADYSLYRDAKGASVLPYSSADGNGDGRVDSLDGDLWRLHYGETLAASPVAAPIAASAPTTSDAVFALYAVEPTSFDVEDSAAPTTEPLGPPRPVDRYLLLHLARDLTARRGASHDDSGREADQSAANDAAAGLDDDSVSPLVGTRHWRGVRSR